MLCTSSSWSGALYYLKAEHAGRKGMEPGGDYSRGVHNYGRKFLWIEYNIILFTKKHNVMKIIHTIEQCIMGMIAHIH